MFRNRFDATSTVDFHVTDLREENSELRRQIATLYSQLLSAGDIVPDTASMSTATSTKSSRHTSREFNNSYSKIAISEEYKSPVAVAEETISTLQSELQSHKAYIKEQANVAKELELKCQQKDEELLRLSLEVVQGIPLKARIKELKKTLEDQNLTIGQLRSECATLHTQLQEVQDEVHKKDSIIQKHENEVTSLTERCVRTELEFQGKYEIKILNCVTLYCSYLLVEYQSRASLESASQQRVGALEQVVASSM